MAPKTLGLVDPKEWISRTSLQFSSTRSGTLARVDAAYVKYYTSRSEADNNALYRALNDYLIEKGSYWEKVDRNKRSGGLMAYIHSTSAPATPTNILQKRVPNARHGMLYLWQRADVGTQWAKIALEGALGIASNTAGMLQASSYNPGDRLSGMGVIGQGTDANLVAKGVGYADTARGRLWAPKGEAKGNSPMPGFNQTLQNGVWVAPEPHPPFLKVGDLNSDPSVVDQAKRALGSAFNSVYETITQKIREMWEDLRLKYYKGELWGTAGDVLVKVTNFILGKVVANAAPLVASGLATAQGICQAIIASKDRITAYQSRNKFVVAPGHPELIGNAIERQMNWAVGKGLYQVAKGGAMLACDIASMGATALINVIAACMEFAWKLLTRILEGRAIKAWLMEVKAVTANRNDWKADPLDGAWRPRICYDNQAFQRLVVNGCNASVCVPMMTLNSGITGDLMMFTKMFDDTGGILGQGKGISSNGNKPSAGAQKQFNAAEAYWTQLKEWGRSYMSGTGFTFSSSDKVAQGLMWHALSHHQGGAKSTVDKALAFGAGG